MHDPANRIKKIDPTILQFILLRYNITSKAYHLIDNETMTIHNSQDMVCDELSFDLLSQKEEKQPPASPKLILQLEDEHMEDSHRENKIEEKFYVDLGPLENIAHQQHTQPSKWVQSTISDSNLHTMLDTWLGI